MPPSTLRFWLTLALLVFPAISAKCADDAKKVNAEPSKVTVDFQASVTFQSGDTKPIASVEFFFLSRSIVEIAKEVGSDLESSIVSDKHGAISGILTQAAGPLRNEGEIAKLLAGVKKYQVISFKTNMSGTAAPKNVPAGDYWVFGVTKLGRSRLIWDYKTTISAGENQVYLDATNAAYAR